MPMVTYAAVSEYVHGSHEYLVQSTSGLSQNEATNMESKELTLNFIFRPRFAWGLVYACGYLPRRQTFCLFWKSDIFFPLHWINGKRCQKKIFRHIDYKNIFVKSWAENTFFDCK